MQELLSYLFLGNTIQLYLISLGYFVGGILAVYVFKQQILRRLNAWAASTDTNVDDFLIKVIHKSVVPALYVGVFYVALHTLTLSSNFVRGLNIAVATLVTFLIARAVIFLVNFMLESTLKESQDTEKQEKQLKGIRGLLNFVIWALALVFLLDNLGVKISAVVAGLGIGGIAVALAAQAVLGDLFSYFVIFFDKPFEIGDFIVVGDKMGVVENIGIKTTRIRALSGEQLVFSNTDLTNSRVHNFKKMEKRRVVFKLGVTYQTPLEKLQLIPQLVREIIVAQPDATFDRGHFATYGDFSLNFEFVYYVLGADYNKYMDIQQAINLAVYAAFTQQAIEFAYPTQTLFLEKST